MRPVLFTLGPASVSTFWFASILGGAISARFWWLRRRAMGLKDQGQYWALLLTIYLSAVVGGKLAHAFLYKPLWTAEFWEAATAARHGISVLGGIAGPVLAVIVFCRLERLEYLRIADYVYLMVPFWDIVGRLGCFLNGCCYGRPTTLPWAIVIPPGASSSVPEALRGVPLHPAQLYQSAIAGAVGLFLYKKILPKVESGRWPRGSLLAVGVGLYGVDRFFLEMVRGDAAPGPGGLSTGQAASLAFVALSGLGFWLLRRRASEGRRTR